MVGLLIEIKAKRSGMPLTALAPLNPPVLISYVHVIVYIANNAAP
jgi:hypothetical protein